MAQLTVKSVERWGDGFSRNQTRKIKQRRPPAKRLTVSRKKKVNQIEVVFLIATSWAFKRGTGKGRVRMEKSAGTLYLRPQKSAESKQQERQ